MLIEHTLFIDDPKAAAVRAKFKPTEILVDVGAGIRPCGLFPVKKHIVVEPSSVYTQELMKHTGEFSHAEEWDFHLGTALEVLPQLSKRATVLLLDVIEHMEKPEGREVVALVEKFDQAMIYTPNGFEPMTHDEWGLGQHSFQTHRSGWFPGDFKGWTVVTCTEGLLCYRLSSRH